MTTLSTPRRPAGANEMRAPVGNPWPRRTALPSLNPSSAARRLAPDGDSLPHGTEEAAKHRLVSLTQTMEVAP